MFKQQITEKLKNVPLNVQSLQVQGSTNSQLNKDENLSAENKVLSVITLDGVLPERAQGLKATYARTKN